MYKITLINMPFTALDIPSIALAQLREVTQREFGDRVRVRILYLNFDLVHYLGEESYSALMQETNNTGMGEWFFRQAAFPELPDNAQDYFRRYRAQLDKKGSAIKGRVLAKRVGLQRFLHQLVHKHQLDKEDLIGLTSMFSQNLPCFAAARTIKGLNPKVMVVMGGANCEGSMGRELAKQAEMIDFVFSGPGLVNFPELVRCQMNGDDESCHRIRGVFSRQNLDSDHLKGPGVQGEELPIDVPVPLDYDSYLEDLKRAFGDRVAPSVPFETSRGCWWGERAHCTFCGLNGGTMAYRAMPSKMALDFIQGLLDRYSDRCNSFQSVDNIMPREYMTEVFPHVKPPADVEFFYEVKADLSRQNMEVLAGAGVTAIQPGIESLASSTLKLMRKGTTAFRNVAFLKNCVRFRIRPAWNLLIGFPGETEDVYEKYTRDLPLLSHLYPPAGAFPVRFDRFSPYHAKAEEYGLDLSPYDFYSYLYPWDKESLMNMAYYFEDRNYNSTYLVHMVSWQQKLTAAISHWESRWSASDGGLKARLFFHSRPDGSLAVRDSRSGEIVDHELDVLELRALQFMDESRRTISDIARHLGTEESEAAEEVAKLQKLGLLFEEGERYMSLVVDQGDVAREDSRKTTGMVDLIERGLGQRVNL